MGKRSNFKRSKKDIYDTPESAVQPLLPFLSPKTRYIEPAAGKAYLIRHLGIKGHKCVFASDIDPRAEAIEQKDLLSWRKRDIEGIEADCFITNPPWTRRILHPSIGRLRRILPTWLLNDADWAHTKQAVPYMKFCSLVVSVGRVSWMENGVSGKDNCAWYLFGKEEVETIFRTKPQWDPKPSEDEDWLG